MSRPIKNRKTFFECLHEGLQRYFDSHDKRFDGVLYITVGVKQGHVGGIIKSNDPFPFAPKEYIGDRLYYEKRVRRREGAAPSNSPPRGRTRPSQKRLPREGGVNVKPPNQ